MPYAWMHITLSLIVCLILTKDYLRDDLNNIVSSKIIIFPDLLIYFEILGYEPV